MANPVIEPQRTSARVPLRGGPPVPVVPQAQGQAQPVVPRGGALPLMRAQPPGVGAAIAQRGGKSPAGAMPQTQTPPPVVPPGAQGAKVQAGLNRIKQRNESVTASLGLQTDKAGNQITDKTHLGTGSLAGQSTRASGPVPVVPKSIAAPSPAAPPAIPPPVIPLPATTPGMMAKAPAAPSRAAVMAAPSRAAAPVGAPVAQPAAPAPPVAKVSLPTAPVTPPVPAAAPAAPVAAPAPVTQPPQVDDTEALQQYAQEQLGGVDFKTAWGTGKTAKVGPRITDGAYKGMSPTQARAAVENNFRKLSPAEKERYSKRGNGLRFQPPGTVPTVRGTAAKSLIPQPAMSEDEALFMGG